MRIPAEPESLDLDTVAAFLDRVGWTASAALVRRVSRTDVEHYQEIRHLNRRHDELVARLRVYEPAPDSRRPDFTPPPEASD